MILHVVGEGETELGHSYSESPPDYNDAMLPCILDKLVQFACGGSSVEYILSTAQKLSHIKASGKIKIEKSTVVVQKPVLKQKLVSAIVTAQAKGCDGLVVQLDREKKQYPSMYDIASEVERDHAELFTGGFIVVVINPCRSVETWLLADNAALEAVFGSGSRYNFGGKAEDRRTPTDLKRELCDRFSNAGLGKYQAYKSIVDNWSPTTLALACPTSFPPSLDSARRLMA